MKQTFIIILLIALIGCKQNKNSRVSKIIKEDSIQFCKTLKFDDSLKECTINYTFGDEIIIKNSILISKANNKYFAENLEPIESYGTYSEKKWKTELDDEKIKLLIEYINNSRIIANTKYSVKYLVSKSSTSVQSYSIAFSNDTIRVPSIYWEKLDFMSLRKNIFKKKYADFDIKKKEINNKIAEHISGKWYFPKIESPLFKIDSIILVKTKKNNDCYCSFDTKYNFYNSCQFNNSFLDYKWYTFDLGSDNTIYITFRNKKDYKEDDTYYEQVNYKILFINKEMIIMRLW